MKIFLSADIEGTAGIAHWDEAERGKADYDEFRELMTAEVIAACEGARAAGVCEVVIKDAHDSGRNIILDRLPSFVKIMRGWSGHPDAMMFGLNSEFSAAIYTGYHAKAGSEANPLAHTTTTRVSRVRLNGEIASEFTFNTLCAAHYNVPSIFISGDSEICSDAKALHPAIHTVSTLDGFGRASLSLAPAKAREAIIEGVKTAVLGISDQTILNYSGPYEISLEFVNPTDAYRASWYPGAYEMEPRTVGFKSDVFFEIQRALRFMMA